MIRKLFSIRLVVLAGFVLITLIECKDAARSARHQGPPRAQYENWVRPYTSRPLTLNFRGDVVRLRLIITAVEGDEENSSQRERSILTILNDRTVAYGCQIFADGRVSYFYSSSTGVSGSGYPTIPEGELERLDKLLANLPYDGARLPPAERRLVVQTPDGNRWRAQVYDRADAPAEILEILRGEFAGCSTNLTGLELLDGDRRLVAGCADGRIRIWDADSAIKQIAEFERSLVRAK